MRRVRLHASPRRVVATLIVVGGGALLLANAPGDATRGRPARIAPATPQPARDGAAGVGAEGPGAAEPGRAQRFAGLLIAARLGGAEGVEPETLRAFWAESVDRGAPDDAIDALARIALANAHHERLAAAALDYRDDLVRLRAAAGSPVDPGEAVDCGEAAELRGGAGALGEGEPAEGSGRIDLAALAELEQVLRYTGDAAPALRAVEQLALYREDIVAEALLLAADHPQADPRRAALEALWRSAADGIESAESGTIRARLERARYDADPRIARLAGRALADLDARRSAGRPAAPAGSAAEGPPELFAAAP